MSEICIFSSTSPTCQAGWGVWPGNLHFTMFPKQFVTKFETHDLISDFEEPGRGGKVVSSAAPLGLPGWREGDADSPKLGPEEGMQELST